MQLKKHTLEAWEDLSYQMQASRKCYIISLNINYALGCPWRLQLRWAMWSPSLPPHRQFFQLTSHLWNVWGEESVLSSCGSYMFLIWFQFWRVLCLTGAWHLLRKMTGSSCKGETCLSTFQRCLRKCLTTLEQEILLKLRGRQAKRKFSDWEVCSDFRVLTKLNKSWEVFLFLCHQFGHRHLPCLQKPVQPSAVQSQSIPLLWSQTLRGREVKKPADRGGRLSPSSVAQQ